MASNSFLRMLFGNSTEPSYAGIRVPRLYSGDDAVLTRQVSPQERYRQYNGASRTEAEQRRLDQVLDDKKKEAEAPRNGKLQGAIQGLGGSLAEIFAQNDQRQPLSLPPVMMGEQIPIIDPRWLPRRENGGPVKKNRPYLVGEDGPEVIVPEDDGTVIPNGRRSVDWDLKEILAPQEETVTETVTEKPEPSTADMLRGQVNDIQRRLAKGATKNPDGTTTYGDKQYRKRNALDVLKSAGLGVLQSLASAPPTNDLGALLGRAIGGGAAGGVMGATMNNADEKMADRMKLAQILPQYQQAYGIERQKKADDLQIENTRVDNEINKLRIESVKQSKADAEVARALKTISGLKWFDPKNPTHAALAKVGKLDPTALQGWDDRRPYTKNVAGVEYIYKDGAFVPSNLPVDEAKTLKDYTVEMPNGEKRTYKVSQKDAANFSTQMSALGARIASNEKIAGLRTASSERIAQLRTDAAMLRTKYQEAMKNGRSEEANRIRLQLKGILDEVDAFQGATGEAIIP